MHFLFYLMPRGPWAFFLSQIPGQPLKKIIKTVQNITSVKKHILMFAKSKYAVEIDER